jgi:hypothetical protein
MDPNRVELPAPASHKTHSKNDQVNLSHIKEERFSQINSKSPKSVINNIISIGVSNGSNRRYSVEKPLNSERPNEYHCIKPETNLLNLPMLQNLAQQPDYELYGFVYKIKAYEISKGGNCSLRHLRKVELI